MSTAFYEGPCPDGGIYALYLHVPFCVRRCRYCDFETSATRRADPLVGRYVEALRALVETCGGAGLLDGVATAYIGGGTPTMAGDGLVGLVRAVRAACPGLIEFTSEANPESLDADMARRLRRAGLTRLSLGVQSLRDEELSRLGRAHDARAARDAMRAAVDAGLDLSCDLMCGIPLQTPETWAGSLEGVLEGGAGHVSCYPLTVEEGTPLWRAVEAGEEAAPDEDAQADMMLAAADLLGAHGLARYEVASYALPGRLCMHNYAYWTGRQYLGLGTGASSMLEPRSYRALARALPLACSTADPCGRARGRERRTARVRLRMTDPARAIAGVAAGATDIARGRGDGRISVEVEGLSAREAAAEDLMLGMRTAAGVSSRLVDDAVGRGIPRASLDRAVESAVARGLASPDACGSLRPTVRGWLLGNELFGLFWDLA